MGNLCAGKDYESERSLVVDRGAKAKYGEMDEDGKARALSTVGELAHPSGPPRIHRDRTLDKSKSISHGVRQRATPLKDCSDELLLAELEHRNIRLHEKVTGDLVHQRYKFGKLLGQGSSAAVYEAVHKRSKLEVAIKVIKKNGDMNDDESMATELEILKMVHHRYILNCHELFETPQCIWVVMELIRGGELLELLIEGGVYTEKDAARAMKQAFLALSYLHSQGIVHRDIKLQNLLLTDKERTSDLKVCDFGLSAQIARKDVDWGDKDAVKNYRGLSDKWGTPQYFAPEMLQKAYGPQVDLWSLGVVLFQLLVGRLPFNAPSNSELFRQIERSPDHLRRLFSMSEWRGVSEPAKDLVMKLLNPDPTKRLNADEALSHEWILLKGDTGGASLQAAKEAFKQQVAQKRLTAMWHVLDIINALDESAGQRSPKAKQLPPGLLKRASQASTANFGSGVDIAAQAPGSPRGNRPRQASATDRIEELQTLFQLFDTDGNGTIDINEIAALFRKLGYEPSVEKLHGLVMQCDSNKNGELEFPEFCEFLKLAKKQGALGISESMQMQLNSLSNESGCISNEDLANFLRTFAESAGHTISDAEIRDVILLADDNSDGTAKPSDITSVIMQDPSNRRKKAAEKRRNTPEGP
jgi:serine/threonine protein kinase